MQARAYVGQLPWVTGVEVTLDAAPQAIAGQSERPGGLKSVAHIIAVSSCKGGTAPMCTRCSRWPNIDLSLCSAEHAYAACQGTNFPRQSSQHEPSPELQRHCSCWEVGEANSGS